MILQQCMQLLYINQEEVKPPQAVLNPEVLEVHHQVNHPAPTVHLVFLRHQKEVLLLHPLTVLQEAEEVQVIFLSLYRFISEVGLDLDVRDIMQVT